MTTAKSFAEYLLTLPHDTEITVLKVYNSGYFTRVEEVPLDLDEAIGNAEFTDLTGNSLVSDVYLNSKTLFLGDNK